jgi:hypothetical protein
MPMKFASLFIALLVLSTAVFAQSPITSGEAFLKLSAAQKEWWYFGAFTAIGHMTATKSKAVSECIWKWYFDNTERRHTQLEESFKAYPELAPTTVILGLLKRDCGEF